MEQFDSTMSSVIDSTLGLRCKLFGYCHYCIKKNLQKSSAIQNVSIILEDFYNLFVYKRFERKDKIEVTNWQPCLFLRFAVSCCQSHSY